MNVQAAARARQQQQHERVLEVLAVVLQNLPDVNIKVLLCPLMRAANFKQLLTHGCRKLTAEIKSLDAAIGVMQWLVKYGSRMLSGSAELEIRASIHGVRKDAAGAVYSALYSLQRESVPLEGLVVTAFYLPATVFSVNSLRSWAVWTSSLKSLQLTLTGTQSVQHLSNLTSLTSLKLGTQRFQSCGPGLVAQRVFGAGLQRGGSPTIWPGAAAVLVQQQCLPTTLCELSTVGVKFTSLTRLTNLTSLRVELNLSHADTVCPVALPAAHHMQDLRLVSCGAVLPSHISTLCSMTQLMRLKIDCDRDVPLGEATREAADMLPGLFQRLQQLKWVSMNMNGGDSYSSSVAPLQNLQRATLGKGTFTAAGMQQLSSLTALTAVRFENSKFESVALLLLPNVLPNLVELSLFHNRAITQQQQQQQAEGVPGSGPAGHTAALNTSGTRLLHPFVRLLCRSDDVLPHLRLIKICGAHGDDDEVYVGDYVSALQVCPPTSPAASEHDGDTAAGV